MADTPDKGHRPDNAPLSKGHRNKRYGTLYEYIFICESLRRDFEPHLPVGDYLPHDIVVYTKTGVCKKVQVKGTSSPVGGRRKTPRYKITQKTGGPKNYGMFDCSLVDVVACYVGPYDTWYLIPCEVITSRSLHFYPGVGESNGSYENYRDCWEIFNE